MQLHEGRPFVAAGVVELWHATCWQVRHARPVEEVTVVAPTPSRSRKLKRALTTGPQRLVRAVITPAERGPRFWAGAGTGTAVVVLACIALSRLGGNTTPSSLAAFDASEPSEAPVVPAQSTSNEVEPPVPDLAALHPIPLEKDTPLDELYPSLLDWMHPVAGTERVLPEYSTGTFGAERGGATHHECGAGHCGVDLGGPRGRAIVAVADGVVVHVERSELGRDGRSGRYVRLEHDDGTLTAYMHLDAIIDGLQVGDHVDGGQQIGTLGATAVYSAAPHLHFSLEIPNVPGTHGDNVNTHYVDPAPFLVRASILDRAERRHPTKPAF
ncbi:MAG TPA: M23 family metallopeptidase [Kofleriaceae bacterium]|nr:M23 family metallopeptidase [Kofleriaceae bacterium]